MSLEALKLTLDDGGTVREYRIAVLEEAGGNQSKEAFSIAPPGAPAIDNIFLGVSGMQREEEIRFAVHNDGTDKADGTAPTGRYTNDTVVTLAEQRDYLLNEIHAESFAASWELDHLTGEMYDALPVFLESIDCPAIQRTSPKWLEARLRLRVGSSVG